MEIIENQNVLTLIRQKPELLASKLIFLRQLIFDVAKAMEPAEKLEETLKWGEPSYLTKQGSTIRINGISSKPEQYAMYFNCKTILVEVFREVYRDVFEFDGNRAIIFQFESDIPLNELKHCITLSLTYHRIKHLPMLGI